jgi:ATP-dependent RNA helicase RhlE
VHRIGRTGRAGAEGAAVNLVSLDEEGFMADIERFTKQTIPVQVVEGFGPEPGEKAEPIAMGRQTIWGGAGKPPSRDVMQAAAKAARTEMLQRVRDNKAKQGGNGSGRSGQAPRGGQGANAGGNRGPEQGPRAHNPRPPQGPKQGQPRNNRPPQGDAQPRSHEGRFANGIVEPRAPRSTPGGQPDPMRTSVDMMADRGGRRGGYGGGNRNGGGNGGSRSGGYGGGGNGPRGSGNPRGPFSR